MIRFWLGRCRLVFSELARYIIIFSLRIVAFFRRKKVVLFLDSRPGSGSNVFALYSYMSSKPVEGFALKLLKGKPDAPWKALANFWALTDAKVIIRSHGGLRVSNDQLVIELWHGIPIKTMGLMSQVDCAAEMRRPKAYLPDIVSSSSRFYETLMTACKGFPVNVYRRTGFPRIEWLIRDKDAARITLGKLIGESISPDKKIFVWLPTHRSGMLGDDSRNQCKINTASLINAEIDELLYKCDSWLIVKLHPKDTGFGLVTNGLPRKRIRLIGVADIEDDIDDFYCLLPGVDALLTDYSSVAFDFMLLDRPIGFVVGDKEEYSDRRGFLVEPVELILPGEILKDQDDIERFIGSVSAGHDQCVASRKRIADIFYPGGGGTPSKSLDRVIRAYIFGR